MAKMFKNLTKNINPQIAKLNKCQVTGPEQNKESHIQAYHSQFAESPKERDNLKAEGRKTH